MTVKNRILTLKLMEKLEKKQEFKNEIQVDICMRNIKDGKEKALNFNQNV